MNARLKIYLAISLLFASLAIAVDVQPAALSAAGLYKMAQLDPNLTAEGVNIGMVCRSNTYVDSFPLNDYRPDVSLKCFKNSKINFFDDQTDKAGISNHSTQIASILVGYDANAFYSPLGNISYEAAAPEAKLDIYEFWYFITDYVFPKQLPKDDLMTMSLGCSSESWWSRGIDAMADNYGMLVIAAIGNGNDALDLPLYPAAGANILAVGVADSNNSLTDFSIPDVNHSTPGPTLDGRCKPDIIAPGNCLIATNDVNEPYKPSGDYSSFAAPVVTGVASLLIQKAKSEPNLQMAVSAIPGNCVLKSILMTSAKKLPGWHKGLGDANTNFEYPLDFKQGAGMIDGVSAYELLTAGFQHDGNIAKAGWDLNKLEEEIKKENVYTFTSGSEKEMFTATLCWNRSYENKYPFNINMNNWKDMQLTLRKVDATGQTSLVDFSDSPVDNVEHIYTNLDPNTTYQLTVSNSPNFKSKGTATYGLSWQTK